MPFDASLPPDHAQVVASVLRSQFNALKDQLDAQAVQIAALQAQLATRAPRVDGVQPMDIPFHDPVAMSDMGPVMAKFNELLTAAQQP